MSGAGLFETMTTTAGELPLWPRHLARLCAAAAALGFEVREPADLRARARALLARSGHDVLRLSWAPSGRPRWQLATRRRAGRPVLRLQPFSIDRSGDPFAAHKSTARGELERLAARARAAGADDALLFGTDGGARETTIGNVFALRHGRWWTPPLDGSFLPGIARAVLLEALAAAGTAAREARLTLLDLRAADAIAVTNAVWGPRPARIAAPVGDIAPLPSMWRQALAAATG